MNVFPPCNLNQIKHSQTRLYFIHSECLLQRFQIYLIDMRENKQALDLPTKNVI